MEAIKITAALIVGSVLLASECQCGSTDEPTDPVDEQVSVNTSTPDAC